MDSNSDKNDMMSIDRLKTANFFCKFENNDQTQSEINSQEFTRSISIDYSLGGGIEIDNFFATWESPNSSQEPATDQKAEMQRTRHGRIIRPPHKFH